MSPANVKGTAGSLEWGTPPALFERLNTWFAFDYDPFASHTNALCTEYSTVDGTWMKEYDDKPYQYSTEDGLTHSWQGSRVYMNPPFTRGLIGQCVQKAYEERVNADIIVGLIPFDPSIRWWNSYVEGHCIVLPLPKRVHFVGGKSGATHPVCVAIWKKTLI